MSMKRAVFFFIFLALSMVVIAVPTKKPRVKCTPALHAAKAPAAVKGSHAAPARHGSGSNGKREPGGTTLCGMNIRGSSSRMCQENPGFIPVDQAGKMEWTPWKTLQPKLDGNSVPSKYQCDHAWELQATVQALQGANFCKAWGDLQTAWSTREPNAKKLMEEEFFRSLKVKANEPKMLFYVGSTFNGDKRAFTANVLANRAHTSSANLKAYFSTAVRNQVKNAVNAIDKDAREILERIHKQAMPHNYDESKSSAEDTAYVCKLDLAEAEYNNGNPVSALWTKMEAAIGR